MAKDKKILNTNSNIYTIVYSAIIVVVVAFLLAFISSYLKPAQHVNVALDKKSRYWQHLIFVGLVIMR